MGTCCDEPFAASRASVAARAAARPGRPGAPCRRPSWWPPPRAARRHGNRTRRSCATVRRSGSGPVTLTALRRLPYRLVRVRIQPCARVDATVTTAGRLPSRTVARQSVPRVPCPCAASHPVRVSVEGESAWPIRSVRGRWSTADERHFQGQLGLEPSGGHIPTRIQVRVLQRVLALTPPCGTTTTSAPRPQNFRAPTTTDP